PKMMSVTAVQNAYRQHIKTYVIGVSNDVTQQHVQDLADAGQGITPRGSMHAQAFVALNPTQVVNAFQQILMGVRTCTFTLNGNIDLAQASNGHVFVDGVSRAFDTEWRLTDMSTLELLGTVCDLVKDGHSHTVTASFPCGSVVP